MIFRHHLFPTTMSTGNDGITSGSLAKQIFYHDVNITRSVILELDLDEDTIISQNMFSADIWFLSDCPFEEELLLNGDCVWESAI